VSEWEQLTIEGAIAETRPVDPDVEIARMSADGYGPTAIALSLNARGVPTPSGRGQWWPATVYRHGNPQARAAWAGYVRSYKQIHGR
jgi:hypothetical protein